MKTRTDFVTNSSSSSYIVAKNSDLTIENIYGTIRYFFMRYISSANKLKIYLSGTKYFDYDTKTASFKPKNDEKISEGKSAEINKYIQEKYKLDLTETFNHDLDWVSKCNTYAEYEEYWKKNIYEKPFNIIDFSVKDFVYQPLGIHSALNLYLQCFKDLKEEKDLSCENCTYKNCFIKKEDFEKIKTTIKNTTNKEQEALLCLGKFCITVDFGDIPDFVLNELANNSNYYLEHIG